MLASFKSRIIRCSQNIFLQARQKAFFLKEPDFGGHQQVQHQGNTGVHPVHGTVQKLKHGREDSV